MKFLVFVLMEDLAKVAEVAQASDKFWASPPPGVKMLANYGCQGMPFPAVLPPKLAAISISVMEAESNELLFAGVQPAWLAGQTVYAVPVLEIPVTGAAAVVERSGG